MKAAMDWLKLFAVLIAVASLHIVAEGAKKKIRIHLPQKVKHIHHHKKIYITNHQAPSQYAPAYLKGTKGAVALPSNIARPAVANIIPVHSVELYGESRPRLPGVRASASKLLPLYRARGRYGPNHSEVDDQDYDLAPPPEADSYLPVTYSANSGASGSSHSSKKIKIVKVNDVPRKKVVRKVKPKRVVVKSRPQPQPQPQPSEDELPVSRFHEQFYSDLEDAGTIQKIRKPPRIEKIIDGDTEHIHTYSEEHIHKVVFDDDTKLTGVVGVDHIGSMSALTAAHPLVPVKNAQTLLAIPSNSIADFTVVGSMGTPSHLEYASYNPRDVTHDHIYHDHGDLPPGVEITKDTLRLPPKVSYDSHGLRIPAEATKHRHKEYSNSVKRPSHTYKTSNSPDFSYYETIFSPNYRPKKTFNKPTVATPQQDISSTSNENTFRPVPTFQFKDKRNKLRNVFSKHETQLIPQFQLQQASVPAPFTVSTTVVHDYAPKNVGSTSSTGFSKLRDPLVDYKDSNSGDFDYEAFASSSSNVYTTGDKNDLTSNGKKSVSTQNISFGGDDHENYVDHLAASASSNNEVSLSENLPTAAESPSFDDATNPATPTPYTIKETSPVHSYYTAMALKALHDKEPEPSNNDLRYAEDLTHPTYYSEDQLLTTTSAPQYYKIQNNDAIQPEYDFVSNIRQNKKNSVKEEQRKRPKNSSGDSERSKLRFSEHSDVDITGVSNKKGNLKYGDKI